MEKIAQIISLVFEVYLIISFFDILRRSKEIIKKQEEQERRLDLIIQQQNKMNIDLISLKDKLK